MCFKINLINIKTKNVLLIQINGFYPIAVADILFKKTNRVAPALIGWAAFELVFSFCNIEAYNVATSDITFIKGNILINNGIYFTYVAVAIIF